MGISPNQLWFLLMLFWVYIFFHPISSLAKNNAKLVIPALIIVYAVSLIVPFPNFFQLKTSLRYLLYFAIGFYIREFDLLCLIRSSKAYIRISVIGGVFLTLFSIGRMEYAQTPFLKASFILIGLLLHCSGAIFAFYLLQIIAKKSDQDSKLIHFGIKYSMLIYLFHQQIIQLCLALIKDWRIPILVSVVCFFVAIILSSILAVVVNKTKALRLLFTGKD
jgi:hypothetical protein